MRLIIFSRKNWVGISRLPFALKQAGFEVGVVCPAGAYLAGTKFIDFKVTYEQSAGRTEIYEILQRTSRDWPHELVLPGDDPAFWFLRNACTKATETIDATYLNTIGRTLGNREYRSQLERKTALGTISNELGIDFPDQLISPSLEESVVFAERYGFPVVLKRDYTFAGVGVSICRDLPALRDNFNSVAEKARFEKDDFAVQRYVTGIPASVSFAALNGKLLAAFAFFAEATRNATGFTSIARIMENEKMIEVAGKLVEYFGFTGLGGVDFQLDNNDRPWLLEINPRPTPTAHLGLRVGSDLCAALKAAVSGGATPAARAERVERVAIFPYAWAQLGEGIGEFSGYHDVPWYDPQLLAMLIQDFWGKCKVT